MARQSPILRMEVAKRRALLMQVVDGSERNLTYEEISAKMRGNRWVSVRWPEYSSAMARTDHLENLSLVEDDIKSMASFFMVKHLDVIYRSIDRMEEVADDDDEKTHIRIAATNAIGPMLEKAIKIFGHYQDTTVKIDKREVSLNLDQYKEIQRRAREDENTIDGELITDLIPMSTQTSIKLDEEE